MPPIELQINGQPYSLEADAQMPLLWALRDLLGLTGTKYSCGAGLCGTCTVLVDGEPTRSCITPLSAVAGKSITTIEGLSEDGESSVAGSLAGGARHAVRILSTRPAYERCRPAGEESESQRCRHRRSHGECAVSLRNLPADS